MGMNGVSKPWLDRAKTTAERVDLLLKEMTREEKVAQMIQISHSIVTPDVADDWAKKGAGSFLHTLGNDARRIQRLATGSRLGIPVLFGIDAIHGHAIHNGATVFPSQLALASSWEPEAAEKVGEVTAREVTAEGLHWTFSPVFCLGRDLRWGRIDETFGEDPYLSGKMGAAIVRGYQGKDPAAADRIAACAKHYVAYGESSGGRDSYDAPVSFRKVRDTFLPPFAEAVRAGCLTVMAGYEPVDGVPVSANKKLLRTMLKDELGFDGFVVTDWSNVTSLLTRHRMGKDAKDVSRLALEAGNDMIMTSPEFYEATLEAMAESERGAPEDYTKLAGFVDDAVRRILSVKFRVGLFDVAEKVKTSPIEEDPSAAAAAAVFNCAEHQRVNLEVARKSITLLKNEMVGGIPALPIQGPKGAENARDADSPARDEDPAKSDSSATGVSSAPSIDAGRATSPAQSAPRARTVRNIAVIGPNADAVRAQFGDWTFFTHPLPHLDAKPTFRVTTMLDGIRAIAEREGALVSFEKGCDMFDPANQSIAAAVAAAEKADIAFLAVGDTLQQTGEHQDRANLALSGAQDELARALGAACRRKGIPLVALLVNGKPLEFGAVAEAADAVIETFNSGTLGGQAAAEIIFGRAEPEGRLPISFPRATGQLPVYYSQIPGWHEGKYYDCEETPLFAFGEGLAYTDFRYDAVELSRATAGAGDTVDVIVTVTNSGARDGTETVQVYATDAVASIVRPVRELKAFAKVRLRAGETKKVAVPLPVDSLALVNIDEKTVLEPGDFEILAGHDSRPQSLLSATLTVR